MHIIDIETNTIYDLSKCEKIKTSIWTPSYDNPSKKTKYRISFIYNHRSELIEFNSQEELNNFHDQIKDVLKPTEIDRNRKTLKLQ